MREGNINTRIILTVASKTAIFMFGSLLFCFVLWETRRFAFFETKKKMILKYHKGRGNHCLKLTEEFNVMCEVVEYYKIIF